MSRKKKPATKRRRLPDAGKPSREDSPLKAHFRKAGILFGLSPTAVVTQLRKLLGRDRFDEWEALNEAKQHGGDSQDEYDCVRTPQEINTLFSLQADISVAVAEWLDQAVALSYAEGKSLVDLGCGTGILAAWLAGRYPSSPVVGCDANANMLSAAATSHSHPNLAFHHWNYRQTPWPSLGRYDILVTSFGIDFPTGPMPKDSLAPETLKSGELYQTLRSFLVPFFSGWRAIANDDAHLHAVLRIPDEATFLAAVDAAHDAGWVFEHDNYQYVTCSTETFPAMSFRAGHVPSACLPEVSVRAAWIRRELSAQCDKPWSDSVAVCLFNSFADKEILKEDARTYDDGHTMKAYVGRTPGFAFQFAIATTGFARLQLLPLRDALTTEPRFEWPAVFEDMFF